MCIVKKIYIIICEGNSEFAYIQKLNRFLAEKQYHFTFVPKRAQTGHFTEVEKKYRKEKKNNKKCEIKIWVDKDTYARDDLNDQVKYESSPLKENFLFSTMNFEDFLALHMDETTLENWHQVCCQKKHHTDPMVESEYLPLVKKHLFPEYKKGDVPFEITEQILERLLKHNKYPNYFCRCGFADFLEELMEKHK